MDRSLEVAWKSRVSSPPQPAHLSSVDEIRRLVMSGEIDFFVYLSMFVDGLVCRNKGLAHGKAWARGSTLSCLDCFDFKMGLCDGDGDVIECLKYRSSFVAPTVPDE